MKSDGCVRILSTAWISYLGSRYVSNQRLRAVVVGRRGGVRCPQRPSTLIMIHDEESDPWSMCELRVIEGGKIPAASLSYPYRQEVTLL